MRFQLHPLPRHFKSYYWATIHPSIHGVIRSCRSAFPTSTWPETQHQILGYPQIDDLFHGKFHSYGWWTGVTSWKPPSPKTSILANRLIPTTSVRCARVFSLRLLHLLLCIRNFIIYRRFPSLTTCSMISSFPPIWALASCKKPGTKTVEPPEVGALWFPTSSHPRVCWSSLASPGSEPMGTPDFSGTNNGNKTI